MECYVDEARTPAQQRIAACITRWQRSGDRRALFGAACAMCGDAVMTTVRSGRYADSAMVLALLEQWAEYYLITVDAVDDDLTLVTPPAWSLAHLAAARSATAPMDAVLLGVSAHCTNDLPQALSDVLRDRWPCSLAQLAAVRRDVDTMLAVVADTLHELPAIIDHYDTGLLDTRAAVQVQRAPVAHLRRLVLAWEQEVWDGAVGLVTAATPGWADALRESIECTAARRAHLLVCRIDDGDALLAAPACDLDRRFPHRHEGPACRLGLSAPVWGLAGATTG